MTLRNSAYIKEIKMLLKDLIPVNCNSLGELDITGITCNSREVKEGFAFVCINGTNVDGHTFA